jgi:hypothetical protein
MRLQACLALLPALGAHGIRIIQSNDDGWAEQYLRSFHNALVDSDHDVVLSAPAENKSGTSKLPWPNLKILLLRSWFGSSMLIVNRLARFRAQPSEHGVPV